MIEHQSWTSTRHAALSALIDPCLVTITGLPGTGKTMLLAELTRTLAASGASVALVRHANDHIAAEGILLVDEADKLTADELAKLCRGRTRCVLAGLPALLERVRPRSSRWTDLALFPLAVAEVAPFVRKLLSGQDRPAIAVTDEAVALLAQHTQGIPRNLRIITGVAAFVACLEGSHTIERDDMKSAIRARSGEDDDEMTELWAAAPANDAAGRTELVHRRG